MYLCCVLSPNTVLTYTQVSNASNFQQIGPTAGKLIGRDALKLAISIIPAAKKFVVDIGDEFFFQSPFISLGLRT